MLNNELNLSIMAKAVRFCLATMAIGLASPSFAEDTTRVIVKYKVGTGDNIKAAIAAIRGKIKHEIFGLDAMAIEASSQAIKNLKNNPHVESVETDPKRYPLLSGATPSTGRPYSSGQLVPYGIKMVQADQLPMDDLLTANRKICIIDSGYDRAHEDLAKNNVTGDDDAGTGQWHTDELHHGTHVAGTIAAINNRDKGVVGVNPNRHIKLHIIKVFGADGWAYSSTLASAANKCAAAKANIITMSLGGGDPSDTERQTFDKLLKKGILSIAAAGNDGNSDLSYPASYPSVMSVAALDESKQRAKFSQFNDKVELAGPGVNVLSTVPMGTGSSSTLKVASTTYDAGGMEGSPKTTVTGALADFGIGDKVDPSVAGKVCLIARGSITFADKVSNCEQSGGIGAVVYNNAAGGFGGTLGTTVTHIPSVTASDTDGAAMKNQLGQNATLNVTASNYAYYNGTSMATPHVSAVAALVWSYFPWCPATQIRDALDKSAEDLGTPGRDPEFGFGLVRAKAAFDYLKHHPCKLISN